MRYISPNLSITNSHASVSHMLLVLYAGHATRTCSPTSVLTARHGHLMVCFNGRLQRRRACQPLRAQASPVLQSALHMPHIAHILHTQATSTAYILCKPATIIV